MTTCTNPDHAFPGTGRIISNGECSACVREQRDMLLDALKSSSFIVDYIMARAEFNRPEERLHWEAAQRNAHAAIAEAEGAKR